MTSTSYQNDSSMDSNSEDLEKQSSSGSNPNAGSASLALQRTRAHIRQHAETVGGQTPKPQPYAQTIGGGKPFPHQPPDHNVYLVEFEGADDTLHPQNWKLTRKIRVALIVAYATIVSSFGSSMWSSAGGDVAQRFNVSTEVTTLGLAFFVLGFATGPIVWAPLSELQGRRLPMIIGAFGLGCFELGVAVGKDLQTVLICRFFGGVFGAAPLTCGAAIISDMFNNSSRGIAISIYSVAAFGGPFIAPTVGGFIVDSYLGWRWTQYLTAIMAFSAMVLNMFFQDESYAAVILVSKARHIRAVSKNWAIHAKQEEIEVDIKALLKKNLSRPLRLLFTEPIVLLLSIYTAFIYGLLYTFLTAYPIVFQQIHGMNKGVGSLPMFGMLVGQIIACAYMIWQQPKYLEKLRKNDDVNVPEWRLPPMVLGGTLFAIGMFWFGWTGFRADIHWIAPTLSGLFTGFGNFMIILQAQNYLLDAYLSFSASAIAANTFARSLAGAGFPMFATYMFDAMHVQWASTLLGCVALIMVPIPIVFYKFGSRIRQRSKFTA